MTRVLVIDGNRDIAAGIAVLLTTYAIEVETASTAEAAEEAIARFAPDAVVLDIYSPGLHSGRLFADFRRRFPGLAIVFTSPRRPENSDLSSLNDAKTLFLQKPFDGASLVDAIRSLL